MEFQNILGEKSPEKAVVADAAWRAERGVVREFREFREIREIREFRKGSPQSPQSP